MVEGVPKAKIGNTEIDVQTQPPQRGSYKALRNDSFSSKLLPNLKGKISQDLPRCARNTSSWPSLQVGFFRGRVSLWFQKRTAGYRCHAWMIFSVFYVISLHLSPR